MATRNPKTSTVVTGIVLGGVAVGLAYLIFRKDDQRGRVFRRYVERNPHTLHLYTDGVYRPAPSQRYRNPGMTTYDRPPEESP